MNLAQQIISEAQIFQVHGNANFGPRNYRDIVNEAVLKVACGYSNGSTANAIIIEHGLVTFKPRCREAVSLTDKGRRYLWAVYGQGLP
jgi:hypothetical protein